MRLVEEICTNDYILRELSLISDRQPFSEESVTMYFFFSLVPVDGHPTGIQDVVGLILQSSNILPWRLVLKSFLLLSLALIQ